MEKQGYEEPPGQAKITPGFPPICGLDDTFRKCDNVKEAFRMGARLGGGK